MTDSATASSTGAPNSPIGSAVKAASGSSEIHKQAPATGSTTEKNSKDQKAPTSTSTRPAVVKKPAVALHGDPKTPEVSDKACESTEKISAKEPLKPSSAKSQLMEKAPVTEAVKKDKKRAEMKDTDHMVKEVPPKEAVKKDEKPAEMKDSNQMVEETQINEVAKMDEKPAEVKKTDLSRKASANEATKEERKSAEMKGSKHEETKGAKVTDQGERAKEGAKEMKSVTGTAAEKPEGDPKEELTSKASAQGDENAKSAKKDDETRVAKEEDPSTKTSDDHDSKKDEPKKHVEKLQEQVQPVESPIEPADEPGSNPNKKPVKKAKSTVAGFLKWAGWLSRTKSKVAEGHSIGADVAEETGVSREKENDSPKPDEEKAGTGNNKDESEGNNVTAEGAKTPVAHKKEVAVSKDGDANEEANVSNKCTSVN